MAGTPQRGPDSDAGQDSPVLFDYAYWKDPEACYSGVVIGLLCLGSADGLAHILLAWDFSWAAAPRAIVGVLCTVALGSGLFGLRTLYQLLGRITVDDDGITFSRLGKHVRISFDEVTDSRRSTRSSAIIIESARKRIVCNETKRFEPCARYLTKRLDGLLRQEVLREPWLFEPEEAARYGDVHEFSHSPAERITGLAISMLHLTGGLGFFALLIVDAPADAARSLGIIAFGSVATLVGVLIARWTYSISGRITLDATGITLARFGRETRIDFNAVDRIKSGRGLENAWVRLHSGDKSIRVSRGIQDGPFLLHLLSKRFPELKTPRDGEVPGFPYIVHGPRHLLALSALLLGVGIACGFARGGGAARIAVPVLLGAIASVILALGIRSPRRVVFDAGTITVEYRRGTRTFDASELRDVWRGTRSVTLALAQETVALHTWSVPATRLVRILRNLYADQLREAGGARKSSDA